MVVFCPNIGILSAVVLSLIPLMRPFAWQSLLLPILPVQDKMLDLLEAPVPFILGVKVSASLRFRAKAHACGPPSAHLSFILLHAEALPASWFSSTFAAVDHLHSVTLKIYGRVQSRPCEHGSLDDVVSKLRHCAV
jgi:hypothetical protein